MRKTTYILLAVLLFLGSAYNTGLRLGCVDAAPDMSIRFVHATGGHIKCTGKSVEKFKPRVKVRYRASEVKLDLCGLISAGFSKPVFCTRQVFFDNYSFHTLSYQNAIRLRGPPSRYSC